MKTWDRAKTRHTSVETEPEPRHKKPCLETVSRQDTCLETPLLVLMQMLQYFCSQVLHVILQYFWSIFFQYSIAVLLERFSQTTHFLPWL